MLKRLRRIFSFADKADTLWNWASRCFRFLWPFIGPAVIGLGLLLWGWLRGNFGPELLAIVLTAVVLMMAGGLSILNTVRSIRGPEKSEQVSPAPVPVETKTQPEPAPPKPNPREQVKLQLDTFIRQGQDLRTVLAKKSDPYLSGSLVDAIRGWGARINQYFKGAYPGRAAIFVDELPANYDDYGRVIKPMRKPYAQYLDERIGELTAIKDELHLS